MILTYLCLAVLALAPPSLAAPVIGQFQTTTNAALSPVTATLHPMNGNGGVNVHGLSLGALDAYLGIPYAQQPTGEFRFKPPQPKVYGASLNATTMPVACMQVNAAPWNATGISEDCLTLSILAPAGSAAAGAMIKINDETGSSTAGNLTGLPVMVFIHGGGFAFGGGSTFLSPAFAGYGLQTQRPFVLVTLNYRLGMFGFGTGPDVAAAGAANLGLKDQLLALRWVKDNIAAFGGDPSKITVFGHAAGAISIGLHMLNSSIDLFRGAIMQSGAPSTTPLWNTALAPVGPYNDLQ